MWQAEWQCSLKIETFIFIKSILGWEEKNGVKKLILGKEHLRLSVVKPKQKGLSNDSEPLQLNNVLACKLQKFGEVSYFMLRIFFDKIFCKKFSVL